MQYYLSCKSWREGVFAVPHPIQYRTPLLVGLTRQSSDTPSELLCPLHMHAP